MSKGGGIERRMLRQLAERQGVEWSYRNAAQERIEASDEALRGVLQALGLAVANVSEIRDSLKRARLEEWKPGMEPVTVNWVGRAAWVDVILPAAAEEQKSCCTMTLETGEARRWQARWAKAKTVAGKRVDGSKRLRKRLRLPPGIPPGYHRLEIEAAGKCHESLLLVAPRKVSPAKGSGSWGLFLPPYALRSRENWGAGDFRDLEAVGRWMARAGGEVLATLPLLPTFLEEFFDPSPYSPISRLFWSEFYIDISQVPELRWCRAAREFVEAPRTRRRLEECRADGWVDYRGVMGLKRQTLELLAAEMWCWPAKRRDTFAKYCKEHPRLRDYARFRAALERQGRPWLDWPERMRNGELKLGDYDERNARYHEYAQWIAEEQISGLSKRCGRAGIQLYLDLPLGVNNTGYDIWRERASFALEASGGAPPDLVFSKGQDWGFAPLHPGRIREQAYRYVREYLRVHLSKASLLRMDHVMGMHRLYWVPRGQSAADGAYVRYRAEEWYAVLALESSRTGAWIVGENLGTVPPEVNDALKEHGVGEMYVAQYELRPEPARPLRPTPRRAVASLNTHDMPPFESFLRGMDLKDRQELGLLGPGGLEAAQEERRRLVLALECFLMRRGYLPKKGWSAGGLFLACLRWLAASPAQLVLVNLEDLWHEIEIQNLPGTGVERANWRRKMRRWMTEIIQDPGLSRMIKALGQRRRRGKRTKRT